MARPMSSDSCASSGHSACGPASERANAVAASRSSRSAFSSASTRDPTPAATFETATRPSTAPPSISAFMASMAIRSAATHEIALQPQRLLAAIGDFAAALQPRRQRIRIAGFDAERALERARRPVRRGAAADSRWSLRGAKIQPGDAPGFGIRAQVGGEVLHRTPAQHDLLGAELDLRRIGGGGSGDQTAQGRQQPRRLDGCHWSLGGEFVGVELARRQHGVQQRRRAESDVPSAGKFQRIVVRAVARFELLQPCRGIVDFDLRRYPPRRRRRLAPDLSGGRARATAPSKRGARASKLSTPSRSADSARWPGSMLR